MPSALVLGGTGLVGRAVARRLLTAGWRVTVTGRDSRRLPADLAAAGVRFAPADRDDAVALAIAAGGGSDLDAPDGLAISRAISGLTGRAGREVLLDKDAPAHLGRHPWHRWPPVVLDTSAARALGYRPVGDYATTVAGGVAWLVGQASRRPAWTPPGIDAEQAGRWFDYAAEDAWLSTMDER